MKNSLINSTKNLVQIHGILQNFRNFPSKALIKLLKTPLPNLRGFWKRYAPFRVVSVTPSSPSLPSLLVVSLLTLDASYTYMTDYLFQRNELTISGENGDELPAPGLQADFSALCDGIFIQAECAYYW